MSIAPLLKHLDAFVGFARTQLRDDDLAAEAVQESLAKALAARDQLDDETRLLAWYYRILRNTIADLATRRKRGHGEVPGDELVAEPPSDSAVCGCVRTLLDQLPTAYAQALRAIEFEGASMEQAAAAAGITVNNLKQRRLRAREQLKDMLQQTCRACATHGCLDCTCAHAPGHHH